MPKENIKMQVDIDTLKKQNVNDLLSIKELYSKLEELQEKTTQIKYIDNALVKKLKKEYNNLKKIILDENIQVKLSNDIKTINSQKETKANIFNNLDELKKSELLKDGDSVLTLGYYKLNDGGNASYKIRLKTDNDVIDNCFLYELKNNLVAEIIINNCELNIKQFGCLGDGKFDNTTILQNIFDKADTNFVVYVPIGVYLISKGLVVKSKITIKGESKHIYDYHANNIDGKYGLSTFKVKSDVSDITLISPIEDDIRFTISNMSFYSDSFKLIHNNTTNIGLKYIPNVKTKNVNAIKFGLNAHFSRCENVFVWGFSGTGITFGGDSLNDNIVIQHCGLGFNSPTDTSITNIRSQFCENGAKITGTTMNNVRIEEISKFGLILGQQNSFVNNTIIDQCGYAGVTFHDGLVYGG